MHVNFEKIASWDMADAWDNHYMPITSALEKDFAQQGLPVKIEAVYKTVALITYPPNTSTEVKNRVKSSVLRALDPEEIQEK